MATKINLDNISSKKIFIAIIALYALVGLAIYSNVILDGIFIFDDYEYVVGNQMLQDPLSLLFGVSDPRQVGYFTFALNYAVGGEDPMGFHLVNVLVHIANSVFVFLLVSLIFRILAGDEETFSLPHFAAAFMSGLVFLSHPLQTQAVSYVTQRFTSLAAFFYLISIFFYLNARYRLEKEGTERTAYWMYFVSFVSALFAMKTKEIAFTIPFTIALFEIMFFRGSKFSYRRFFFLIPLFAASFVIPLSILGPEWSLIGAGEGIAEVTRKEKVYDLFERPAYEYFYNQVWIVLLYIYKLLLPVKLQVIHDIKASRSFFELRVILSLLFLLLLAGSAFVAWFRPFGKEPKEKALCRLYAIGIFWFFITASVESSFIPIKDLIFEHRVYLPNAGLIASFCSLMFFAADKCLLKYRFFEKAGLLVLSLAVVLSVSTYIRNNIYTDAIEFWSDVVKKVPDKAIGYHNRGNEYAKVGRLNDALDDINKTISYFHLNIGKTMRWESTDFTPTNMAKTYMNRGAIYRQLGQSELADADYAMARKMVSEPVIDIENVMQLAAHYYKKGAYKHAAAEYSKVISWFPDNVDALNDRGNAYSQGGQYKEAIADFDRVLELRPDFILAYHNRGVAYAWLGKKQEAVEDFRKACGMGFKTACDSIELAQK